MGNRSEMKTKKRKSDAEKPSYQPSPQEPTALRDLSPREAAKTALKVLNGGEVPKISADHPEDSANYMRLMEALGTGDKDFADGLLRQLINAGSPGRQFDVHTFEFMLSFVKGVQPKDQIEAMLAAQMVAVHMAIMRSARRLQNADNIPQQDSAERAFNKLARTFATQMEALKRYRTGGEQKVTVQHVSVQEGGQAIVGNVTQSPREAAPQRVAASPPALTDARTAPMPIIEEGKERVRVPLKRKSNK
jgi:hypothetical protein